MRFVGVIFILLVSLSLLSFIVCEGEEGEGDHPQGGHDQPPPSEGHHGEEGNDDKGNKNGSDQGYSQGFNQGVKPYSYGYNTGIKPYSYNFYQPYGGKPQIVHNDPNGEQGKDGKEKSGSPQQQTPPPIPVNIDFPEFGDFGLNIPIPPPQPPQGHQSQQKGATPFNFVPQQGQQHQRNDHQPQQTPPPFNYDEYGIPTNIGSATLTGLGGQQRQQPQQQPFGLGLGPVGNRGGIDGDDFGIFGGGNQNNNNNNANNLAIPVLEEGNNNNNNQNQLGIPLFGGGGSNNPNNDFNFGNDFNVAASDFAPFNFQNFVPEELTSIRPDMAIPPSFSGHVAGNNKQLNPSGQQQDKQLTKPLQPQLLQKVGSKKSETKSSSTTAGNMADASKDKKTLDLERRKKMYESKKKLSKRSINEQEHEKQLKDDPNSAWSILNMDPQFTNPNQGVYSYYPAYRMPS